MDRNIQPGRRAWRAELIGLERETRMDESLKRRIVCAESRSPRFRNDATSVAALGCGWEGSQGCAKMVFARGDVADAVWRRRDSPVRLICGVASMFGPVQRRILRRDRRGGQLLERNTECKQRNPPPRADERQLLACWRSVVRFRQARLLRGQVGWVGQVAADWRGPVVKHPGLCVPGTDASPQRNRVLTRPV